MATLYSRRYMNRRVLETLGNKDPEELGRLLLDMMENSNNLYNELGLNDGENDTFEYTRDMKSPDENGDAYLRLQEEYKRRFSGLNNQDSYSSNDIDIPLKQPRDDTITEFIEPNSGQAIEIIGEEPIINDRDIFGDEY